MEEWTFGWMDGWRDGSGAWGGGGGGGAIGMVAPPKMQGGKASGLNGNKIKIES